MCARKMSSYVRVLKARGRRCGRLPLLRTRRSSATPVNSRARVCSASAGLGGGSALVRAEEKWAGPRPRHRPIDELRVAFPWLACRRCAAVALRARPAPWPPLRGPWVCRDQGRREAIVHWRLEVRSVLGQHLQRLCVALLCAAAMAGVKPSFIGASRFAACSASSLSRSEWPGSAAIKAGVAPSGLGVSRFAPCSASSLVCPPDSSLL